jgi:hypothetical protein
MGMERPSGGPNRLMRLSVRHLPGRHGWTVDGIPPRIRQACLVISRTTAAIGGGYALTDAATLLLARVSPFRPLDRVMTSMMMSFPLYAAIVIWGFAARSVLRVWLLLAIGTLGCSLLAWLAGNAGP